MAFLLLLEFVSWERASYSNSAAREKGNPEPLTHFSNSTSHSQSLGFGFSAHESALWRGMPCFNKNLTLYFPVGCCYCSRYPLRDQEQGEAVFWMYSGSYSGGSQFHHDKYCRRSWDFFLLPDLPVQYALRWKECDYMYMNILQGEWKKWEGESTRFKEFVAIKLTWNNF